TGASCVDAYAPASGNPATPLGTLTGSRMDIAAANNTRSANLLCTFRNSWVLAQDDNAATPPGVSLAGTSVLANDAGASLAITTLNGSGCGAFPCVRALALGNLSMNADGSYVFDPTPGLAGIATVPYGVVDPENVAGAASLAIRIDPTATANPDTGTATAGSNSTPIANVAANDQVNGVPATLGAGGNAVVSTVGAWPAGLALDPNTGAVTATAGLPPSVAYVLDYRLFGRVPPAQCANAQATVLMLPLADMGVTLQVPSSRPPDTPVQAGFTCTNHGPIAAVGASCSLAPISGASVSCTPAAIPNPLPVGGAIACSVTIPASAFASGTPLVLQATASSSTPDHVPANNTAQAQLPTAPTAIPVGGPMLPLMGLALAALAALRLRRRR
ncbi:MAG TPA: Ig-like domain-containing protein, partial [Pseudorhodoferax sp.]|nr:Ig-like domain-containing protein [Pseudorhodoferax sp.]